MTGGITLLHSSLLKFILALNSLLLFRKLLVFMFLLGMSETFLYSMFASLAKVFFLVDAL
jgi:hypothetical protein